MRIDTLIENINIATMQKDMADIPYGHIKGGLIAIIDKKIAWVGKRDQAPKFTSSHHVDGQGGWVTPGLIDCHTHIVYGGHRALEFEQRLQGLSYKEVAERGGGIMSTVHATREADDHTLRQEAFKRLQRLHEEGVTTLEIKSGYGLDLNTELRLLRIARSLESLLPITVKTTYLGAHALPPEYKNQTDQYIDFICTQVIPEVSKEDLADAVDVFCENIAFNVQQCRRVFEAAERHGLKVKAHAEQLSYQGGANLVAEFSGLSVDHLEYLPEHDIANLIPHNITAVLLPAAFYYLHETQKPPVQAMREHGLAMAVASDCNPGSAPMTSLLIAMNQACVLFGLTPEESLLGVTRHAASALGLAGHKGQVIQGYDADLLLWDIDHPAQLSYSLNTHRPQIIWVRGVRV